MGNMFLGETFGRTLPFRIYAKYFKVNPVCQLTLANDYGE
jgi:hypothetical protein